MAALCKRFSCLTFQPVPPWIPRCACFPAKCSFPDAFPDMIQGMPALRDLPSPLRPYQVDGVEFLLSTDGALLADEMGLGKTVQTVAAIKVAKRAFRRILLVTPTPLSLNWLREFQFWAPNLVVRRLIGDAENRIATYKLPIHVLIASYEQVRLDIQGFRSQARFDLVVLDEAQRIKNMSSSTNLACRLIQRNRSWALSGTPLENEPDDLISIFRFLRPRLLRSEMSLPEIHSAMAPHFLRRTKRDVLQDLPPLILRDIRLELSFKQRQAYNAIWDARIRFLSEGSRAPQTANLLAVLTRLKQICNVDMDSQESVKLEVVRNLLEKTREASEKVLIFSQYVETLRWLSSQIDLAHEIFHGGLRSWERDRVLASFKEQPGPRALLISLRAGGVGLNLQEASTVILFDRWWNPAVEQQAMQRAHRFGRQSPLQVVRFIVEDTVEEQIAEILERKDLLFDDYVESAPRAELKHILQI